MELEAADADVVEAVNHKIVERGRQDDVSISTGKCDVGRTAQMLARPIFRKNLKLTSGQVEDINGVRTMARYPEPSLHIERDTVRYVPGHMDTPFEPSCGAVIVYCDS